MKNEHGGDIYRHSIELDYSVCVNPLGMPSEAMEAAIKGLQLCGSYPDVETAAMRKAVSEFLTVYCGNGAEIRSDWILPGNGAAELIYTIARVIRPRTVILLTPGFSEYETAATIVNAHVQRMFLREAESFCFTERIRRELLDAIGDSDAEGTGPRIVFLCNPNNPTGYRIPGEDLLKILHCCESAGVYLCLDECFLPFFHETEAKLGDTGSCCEDGAENFGKQSLIPQLKDFPHLLILRAFTKIYGMAGLRLGYLLTSDNNLMSALRSDLQPWNVSIPAQMAGIAALKSKGYLEKTKTLIMEERRFLLEELNTGLAEQVYGHDANFIFFRAEPGLKEALIKRKVLIRKIAVSAASSGENGQERSFYRIGIRTKEENRELIRRWRELRSCEWES